ncbi:MAG: UDP-N-acetylglucosamine--N-acetylmuramyl-(pentapeptide) pyrophosphoryl-undecaprenol N-acetylglucosamine transferase [Luteimonas sp.]
MPSLTFSDQRRTIALAAGGTGGHLFPAEALARELIRRGRTVVLYTERRGAGYTQALQGLPHVVLPARSLSGGVFGKAAAAITIARAALQARGDMRRRGVELLVGFGGYPSFAPALAAKSLRLPLLLHEQATRLSLANRQLLRFADGVATSFARVDGLASFPAARIVETGNPVRQQILEARAVDAHADYTLLDAQSPIALLVVGGSQSANVFGAVVPQALLALPAALRRRIALSLQYKGDDADAIAARLREADIVADLQPFFTDMGARLRAAHLVITRAGATTAADLLTVGRPAIFVPIPQGGSRIEQRHNADTLAQAGVGWCMPEPEFTPEALSARLIELFADPPRLMQAAASARDLARPDAAARLADVVEGMMDKTRKTV